MKKLIIHTILSGALLFTGCNKWLDVKPLAQSTKDEMFSTQKGYRDALTGAYIHMKSNNSYGSALMWGNIEFLSRSWDVANPSNLALTALANANYADANVKNMMADTYANQYKIVADVNSILESIDEKKSLFTGDNYRLIKGEALALRAFTHFDVLRMFGPMPDNPGSAPVLPYVKAVSKEIVLPVTYQDFAQAVLADLDEAEALLKDVDPITKYSLSQLNPSTSNVSQDPVVPDDFYMYRQIRMNYYAVLALKARVNLWLAAQGPVYRENAVKYAQMVIDAKDNAGVPTYRLGRASDIGSGDFTMSCEHIAALSIYGLKEAAIGAFMTESSSLVRYDFNYQDGYYYMNNLFPIAERTSDVRYVGMWAYRTTTSGTTNYVQYKKFLQKENQPILQLPLLRLSEMYLILTECAQSKETAEGFYRTYCESKGIPFTNGFNAAGWETDRKNRIIREYVREFYGEGQSFFTYKRFNVTSLPASWTGTFYSGNTARYIVPKPDREINYHNK